MLRDTGPSKVVTEHGRALLNYCASLLDALSARGQLDTGWLSPSVVLLENVRNLAGPSVRSTCQAPDSAEDPSRRGGLELR